MMQRCHAASIDFFYIITEQKKGLLRRLVTRQQRIIVYTERTERQAGYWA
jgi:hypothetical protein